MKTERRVMVALVIMTALLFSSVSYNAFAQGTGSYLENWGGRLVDVHIQRGDKSGWLTKVKLKEVTRDGGVVLIVEGREQYVPKDRIISVVLAE
jgi:hypothetical protein